MQSKSGQGECIDPYALVSYIPGPLGKFLDDLRRQLEPSCTAQSHVTVLTPRTLALSESQAKIELERELAHFAPFTLDLPKVEFFEATSVIYLSVGGGTAELKRMHDRLNRNGLAYPEPYEYHPHVTLAQDFPPQGLPDMLRIAEEEWADFKGDRSFQVECLTFVRNVGNRWHDLADFPLGDPVLAGGVRR